MPYLLSSLLCEYLCSNKVQVKIIMLTKIGFFVQTRILFQVNFRDIFKIPRKQETNRYQIFDDKLLKWKDVITKSIDSRLKQLLRRNIDE